MLEGDVSVEKGDRLKITAHHDTVGLSFDLENLGPSQEEQQDG